VLIALIGSTSLLQFTYGSIFTELGKSKARKDLALVNAVKVPQRLKTS